MNIVCHSFYLVLRFLSSAFCNFQDTNAVYVLLDLMPKYLIFFGVIINGIIFSTSVATYLLFMCRLRLIFVC